MSFRSATIGSSAVLMAALLAFSPLSAEEAPSGNPLSDFLHAADRNDFPAMKALLASDLRWTDNQKITPDIFVARIGNCYLRRVYKKDGPPEELIAAWMCDEGTDKSRVVLGSLARNTHGQVLVGVTLEQKNNRPAPPRTGSAFAD